MSYTSALKQILDLSSMHARKEDFDRLDAAFRLKMEERGQAISPLGFEPEIDLGDAFATPALGGWFFRVSSIEPGEEADEELAVTAHGFSEALENVIRFSQAQAIPFIYMHEDGFQIDQLPTFEW